MHAHPRFGPVFSPDQLVLALLLIVGLYFPSSIGGEHSTSAVLAAFLLLAVLLARLGWKLGVRYNILVFVSLPVVIVLSSCTLLRIMHGPIDFDAGLFLKFSALAAVLALDLREARIGPLVQAAFAFANLLNITCGFAVLAGSSWVGEFLPTYYWTSDSSLVPLMLSLHKPILTFGSHALAGLFTYLFFWLSWENYRFHGNRLSLIFAFCYFILLLALTSFTSLGFALVALAQMAVWAWKQSRKTITMAALALGVAIMAAAYTFADEIAAVQELPQFAEAKFLNSEHNGPLSRYGPEGTLRPAMTYLFEHPFSPLGFERSAIGFDVGSSPHFFVGDSGPLEYMLRGSLPLLLLIYFGLYRFLRDNLTESSHWIIFFVVVMIFETGFSALDSSRTLFLLPFLVAYLNYTASASRSEKAQFAALRESHSFSG